MHSALNKGVRATFAFPTKIPVFRQENSDSDKKLTTPPETKSPRATFVKNLKKWTFGKLQTFKGPNAKISCG